jgi:serine/threonine protein kinase
MSRLMGREDERTDALVGTTLTGRWRIVGVLGSGGMSTVYEAEDVTGARVAIKVLHERLERNRRARERFLREGRLASRLAPADTARILDSTETPDGRPALVMEQLIGQTLRKRCEASGGRLDADDALRIAERVAEILVLAHAGGIIHRDIKPENVFVTLDQQVKVLDFGVAALRDEVAQAASITQSGATLGTPAFMAPEQARGRRNQVDARADIWALGATLFYCLTGRHVHEEASSANESLIFSATQRAPPLARFRPDLADTIGPVVDQALAFDPRDRWASANQMRDAIRAARHALEGRVGGTPTGAADTIETVEHGVPSFPGTQPRKISWLFALLPAAALIALLVTQAKPAGDALPAKRASPIESARVLAPPMRTATQSASLPISPAATDAVQHQAKPPAPKPRVTNGNDPINASKPRPRAGLATAAVPSRDDDVPNIVLDRRK